MLCLPILFEEEMTKNCDHIIGYELYTHDHDIVLESEIINGTHVMLECYLFDYCPLCNEKFEETWD